MTQDNEKNHDEKDLEIWQRMYEEDMRYARHHETLRFHSTSIIVLISAAMLAYLSSDAITESNVQNFMMGAFLFIVNVLGILISGKHYERSRRHAAFAREYRKLIFKTQEPHRLKEARKCAEGAHRKRFRIIHKKRAYWLWCLIHILLAFLGVFIMYLSLSLSAAPSNDSGVNGGAATSLIFGAPRDSNLAGPARASLALLLCRHTAWCDVLAVPKSAARDTSSGVG